VCVCVCMYDVCDVCMIVCVCMCVLRSNYLSSRYIWEVAIIKLWLCIITIHHHLRIYLLVYFTIKQWRVMTVQSLCSRPMVCVCVCVCVCVMCVCVCDVCVCMYVCV